MVRTIAVALICVLSMVSLPQINHQAAAAAAVTNPALQIQMAHPTRGETSAGSAPHPTALQQPSASRSPSARFTIGLVTNGSIHDGAFSQLAYLGCKTAEETYGTRCLVLQSRSGSQYVPNLTHFGRMHAGLTIAVAFHMQNAIYQVARRFPQQKFAIVDGAPADARGLIHNLPNVANVLFKEQESGYLVGVIAGLMERNRVGKATHGVIGVMGGQSIPAVNRYIAGYFAGARAVDPSIGILRSYSQSFANQAAGKKIGLAQIRRGADILFQVAGASGLGYLAAAREKGRYGIGSDADQGFLGSYVITSALKKVDRAVEQTILATKNGRFTAGDHWLDLTTDATGFVPPRSVVPRSIIRVADSYETKIKNGSIVPPTIPPPH